jgi:flagellar biosynthesis protein FlhF
MQLKRYRSRTVQDALAQARRELGPEALVLSTRLVPAPGPKGWLGRRVVEVTAAADSGEPQVSAGRPLRQMFRQHWSEMGQTEAGARHEALLAQLEAAGLDPSLAQRAVDALPKHVRREVPASMVRRLLASALAPVAGGSDSFAPVEVFVGPPGAGKTTTIAKLAAQERARRGVRFTLVAADAYRVGAVEQLRLYADIVGSTFIVARTLPELESILDDQGITALVDTAGRSPRDPEARALFELLRGRPGVRTHLVVPAARDVTEMERVLDGFAISAPARVALTKLDESDSIAPLLGPLHKRDLRVSFLGTGQRVPEDLERGTAAALAAHVMGVPPAAEGAQ